jgi:hypothetical protein
MPKAKQETINHIERTVASFPPPQPKNHIALCICCVEVLISPIWQIEAKEEAV